MNPSILQLLSKCVEVSPYCKQNLETTTVVFANTKVNLTSEDMRHLGSVIRSHPLKERYVNSHLANLNNQLQLLSKITETEPQLAYTTFAGDFTNKLRYFI